MTAQLETDTITRGILLSATAEKIILTIPHTDYQLHLLPSPSSEPARVEPVGANKGVHTTSLSSHLTKRIKGIIRAEALRIHATSETAGGGRFIEPVIGTPRIIAGRIKAADRAANQLVVDVAVPFVLSPLPEQDWSILDVGRMVNCYIKSGATFELVEE